MSRTAARSSSNKLTGSTPVSGVPLTISCWFKADDITQQHTMVSIGTIGSADNRYALLCDGTIAGDPLRALARVTSDAGPSTTTGYSAETWHHACAVFASTTSRSVYLDGGGKATNTTSVSPGALNDICVFGLMSSGGTGTPFGGELAEVAVWSAALTDEEVAALARGVSPLRIRPGSLVAYWPVYGSGSPEPNFRSSNFALTVNGTLTQAEPARVQPPFGRSHGWLGAFSPPPGTFVNPGVGELTATGFVPVAAISGPQHARPSSDVSTGGWTATPLWEKLDEADADDATTEVVTGNNPSNDAFVVGLAAVTDPEASTGHVARARVKKSASGGRQIDFSFELRQGATTKASWSATNVAETYATFTHTLSSAEADSITDYSDLRIFVSANTTGSGAARAAHCTWVELEVPEVAGGTTVLPGVGALTATGFAPAVATPLLVLPGVGALDATGFAPALAITVLAGVGEATLTGFAPTLDNPHTVFPGAGALDATGFAPVVVTPVVVLPDVGALTATGFEPVANVEIRVLPGLGELTAAGFAPAIDNPHAVFPDVGALTATGLAPAAHLTITVTPGLGQATLAGLEPTVAISDHQTVLPGVGELTAAGFAPTAATPVVVTPGLGEVTADGFAPVVDAGAGVTVLPGVGILDATGFAPTAATPVAVLPGLGELTANGFSPTVQTPLLVLPGLGELAAAGLAPTIATPVAVLPGVGALDATGFAPAVATPVTVLPDVGALTAAGFAPVLDHAIVAGLGVATLTGFAPAIGVPVTVSPGTGQATLAGFAPAVSTDDDVTVEAGFGELVLAGLAPAAVGGGDPNEIVGSPWWVQIFDDTVEVWTDVVD